MYRPELGPGHLQGRPLGHLRRLPHRVHVRDALRHRRRPSPAVDPLAPLARCALSGAAGHGSDPGAENHLNGGSHGVHQEAVRVRRGRRHRDAGSHGRRLRPDHGRGDGHRDQGRQHQPLQRSRLGLRHHRQGHRRLLQEGQRRGRHQRPQDQLHHLRRRLLAAQDRRDGAQARRGRPGRAPVPDPGHPAQQRDPQVHATSRRCRTCSWPPAPPSGTTPRTSLDDGLPAQLPDGGPGLRGGRAQEAPEREGRHPVPERRLREGLPQGLRGRPGRGRQEDDRPQAELRGDRPHHRLADRQLEEQRRHRVLQHHDPEVRGAGHQEVARHRLEARALPEQRLQLAGHGAEAGRARGLQGPHHRAST